MPSERILESTDRYAELKVPGFLPRSNQRCLLARALSSNTSSTVSMLSPALGRYSRYISCKAREPDTQTA